jgi:hypothetical protein
MAEPISSYRDLMYAIAKRAKELGNMKMPELKLAAEILDTVEDTLNNFQLYCRENET